MLGWNPLQYRPLRVSLAWIYPVSYNLCPGRLKRRLFEYEKPIVPQSVSRMRSYWLGRRIWFDGPRHGLSFNEPVEPDALRLGRIDHADNRHFDPHQQRHFNHVLDDLVKRHLAFRIGSAIDPWTGCVRRHYCLGRHVALEPEHVSRHDLDFGRRHAHGDRRYPDGRGAAAASNRPFLF